MSRRNSWGSGCSCCRSQVRVSWLRRLMAADRFCRALNHLALAGLDIEGVIPADDNVHSVYEYLIGSEEATR